MVRKNIKNVIAALLILVFANQTNAQLTVSFTHIVNSPRVDFKVTTSGGSSIVSQTWNYNGSTVNYGSNFAIFASQGVYNVCVAVTDTLGSSASFCDSVVIPCRAGFTFSNNLLQAQFNNTSFNNGNDYTWDFGDGSVTSALKSPSHVYNAAGTYNVCLTVVDSLTNCTNTFCDSITVISSYQCNALFSYTILNQGLVKFTNQSTSNFTIGHNWDLGNAQTFNNNSSSWNYQYVYNGTYTVCLTLTDSLNNCTSTFCDTIVLSGIPPRKWDIYGNVLVKDSQTVDSVRVFLIKEDTNLSSPFLVAVDSIDSKSYKFTVEEGIYYLKAALKPNANNFGSYLPTYYGQKLLWGNAKSILLTGTAYTYITLIKGANLGGPGFIGGYVSQGANLLPGDPIPGVDIVLTDYNDNGVAHIKSNGDGRYEFTNLFYGTYKLFVDMLNIPSNPIIITIDQDAPEKNIIIEVNSNGINQVETGIVKVEKEVLYMVYPNPTSGVFAIQFNRPSSGKLEVYNTFGELVYSYNVFQDEKATITLPNNLSNGVYNIHYQGAEIVFQSLLLLSR